MKPSDFPEPENAREKAVAKRETPSRDLSRREFLTVAAALSVVGLAGCANNLGDASSTRTAKPLEEGEDARNAPPVMARVITPKMFAVPGGGLLKDGEAIVFGVPNGAPGVVLRINGKLSALSAKCTHVGCTLLWETAKSQLRCPCHNSHFDVSGKVLNGPAKLSLPKWTVSAQGDDAIVTL